MARRDFSAADQAAILWESRRRCALCLALKGDSDEKRGQIAHVDRDHSNNARSNGAFLCTKHHDRYDSTSRQTKGYTEGELRNAIAFLREYIASGALAPRAAGVRIRGAGVSLEVFNRRLPTYHTTMAFVRTMLKGGVPELPEILKFSADTELALFMFGDAIAEYLTQLFRKALRLHVVASAVARPEALTPEATQEEMELLLWFSDQLEETRRRFAPHLLLGRSAG